MAEMSCVVIAQGLPKLDNGLGVAIWSSLATYVRTFRHVDFICVGEERESDLADALAAFPTVRFWYVPIIRRGYLYRFLRSIPAGLPACVTHMASAATRASLFERLESCLRDQQESWCIIENLAPSIFATEVKRRFPGTRMAYRSHDVSELAFLPFTRMGSWPVRLAWRREISALRALESRTLAAVDRFWTITDTDRVAYAGLHRRQADGVFGVLIDVDRYESVEPGSWSNVLYLGSSDLRKSHGLRRFLVECWPKVRRMRPDAEFHIGGPGTESFDDPGAKVRGLGYVRDELGFLGQGRILINPQEAGSGIKLKSLVAMAAGKVLVSTANGVSGISEAPETRFFAVDSVSDMAGVIERLWRDPANAEIIAAAGRQFVRSNYNLREYRAHDRHFASLVAG